MRHLAALLLLPALASPALADALADGEKALRHRDAKAAVAAFDRALTEAPADPFVHFGRQEAARLAGKADALPAEYERRWLGEPTDPALAAAYARLLPPADALKVLEKASPDFLVHVLRARALAALADPGAPAAGAAAEAACPPDARSLCLLAAYYEDAGDLSRAESTYLKAAAAAPDSVPALVGAARCRRVAGRAEEAIEPLKKALDLDAEDPYVHYSLGITYLARDDAVAALICLNQALSLDLRDLDALVASGEAHLLVGQPKDAIERLKKAVEFAPDRVDARLIMAYALEVQNLNDDAIAAYEEAARLAPLNADCHIGVGWILLKKGKYTAAIGKFRQAADVDPEEPTALFLLGFTHDLMGQWAEATAAYTALLARRPDYARAWNNLGLDQDLLGKPREALENLQRAVNLEPDNLEFGLNLGNTLYNAKKHKEAVAVFERLTKAHPRSVHAWSGYARCLNAARQYPEAAAAYEKAIEFSPEEADLHMIVGVIYKENLREYAKALDHFGKYLKFGGADPVVEGWVKECEKKVR